VGRGLAASREPQPRCLRLGLAPDPKYGGLAAPGMMGWVRPPMNPGPPAGIASLLKVGGFNGDVYAASAWFMRRCVPWPLARPGGRVHWPVCSLNQLSSWLSLQPAAPVSSYLWTSSCERRLAGNRERKSAENYNK